MDHDNKKSTLTSARMCMSSHDSQDIAQSCHRLKENLLSILTYL